MFDGTVSYHTRIELNHKKTMTQAFGTTTLQYCFQSSHLRCLPPSSALRWCSGKGGELRGQQSNIEEVVYIHARTCFRTPTLRDSFTFRRSNVSKSSFSIEGGSFTPELDTPLLKTSVPGRGI